MPVDDREEWRVQRESISAFKSPGWTEVAGIKGLTILLFWVYRVAHDLS